METVNDYYLKLWNSFCGSPRPSDGFNSERLLEWHCHFEWVTTMIMGGLQSYLEGDQDAKIPYETFEELMADFPADCAKTPEEKDHLRKWLAYAEMWRGLFKAVQH